MLPGAMSEPKDGSSVPSNLDKSQADDANSVTDKLEARLVETLSTHLREVVQSAFVAEAAKWSAHLQSRLSHMETELAKSRGTKSPQRSWVGSKKVTDDGLSTRASSKGCSNGFFDIEDDTSSSRLEPQISGVISEPSLGSPSQSGCPTSMALAGQQHRSWRAAIVATTLLPRRSLTGVMQSERAVEDIGSLEQRLATDIIAAKLGRPAEAHQVDCEVLRIKCPDNSCPHRFSGRDSPDSFCSRLDPVLATDSGGRASSSWEGSSSPMKASLSSKANTPMSFKRGERMSMANLQGAQWHQATKSFYRGEKSDGNASQSTHMRLFVGVVPKLLGMIPWDANYRYSSKLYQSFVVIVSAWSTALIIMDMTQRVEVEDGSGVTLVGCLNIVLAFGGLLGLCSCLIQNIALVNATGLLESYASRADFCIAWDKRSGKDVGCALLAFALCIGIEVGLDHSSTSAMVRCAVMFITFFVLGLYLHLLRLCRGLSYIIDMFCNYMMENTDFADAVQEWYLLHATSRSVCTSFQLCFLVLQSVAIGSLSFAVAALYVGLTSNVVFLMLPGIFPGVLCAIAIVHLSMCASSFTHKCSRVPMLVNSAALDDLDPKRIYLVDYIVKSQAGFYIFDVQLSSGIFMKIFYVACAAAFAFTTQALTWK